MEVLESKAPRFVIHEDRTPKFHNRVCVSSLDAVKRKILDEDHNNSCSVLPGGNKLYKDLKLNFLMEQYEVGSIGLRLYGLESPMGESEVSLLAALLQPLEVFGWK